MMQEGTTSEKTTPRIAGLTSMMTGAIIMTTSAEVTYARDVFVDNEVYRLSLDRYRNVNSLGGIVWLRKEPPRSAHLKALVDATTAVERAFPSYRLWLLGTHTAVRPDSAVSRHLRLWKSLERQGIELPTGERIAEVPLAVEGGTRWFGAISIARTDVPRTFAVLDGAPASTLVAVPPESGEIIKQLVADGWGRGNAGPSPEVVMMLDRCGGVTFMLVGGFDDPESGVVAFGRPEVIAGLASVASC
jgi:hypothetical protein